MKNHPFARDKLGGYRKWLGKPRSLLGPCRGSRSVWESASDDYSTSPSISTIAFDYKYFIYGVGKLGRGLPGGLPGRIDQRV